jgi:anti-anti-sigma factor
MILYWRLTRCLGAGSRAIPNIAITVSIADGLARVNVSGELDLSTQPAFESTLHQLRVRHMRIRLDLTGLEFMDMAGLHALERAIMIAQRDDSLKVDPHVSAQVRRLLEVARLEELLET